MTSVVEVAEVMARWDGYTVPVPVCTGCANSLDVAWCEVTSTWLCGECDAVAYDEYLADLLEEVSG